MDLILQYDLVVSHSRIVEGYNTCNCVVDCTDRQQSDVVDF